MPNSEQTKLQNITKQDSPNKSNVKLSKTNKLTKKPENPAAKINMTLTWLKGYNLIYGHRYNTKHKITWPCSLLFW